MDNIKSMTVSTVIGSVSSGQMRVNDLAIAYGKTDRTIQKYIKSLGYVWNAKERKYLPTGDLYDSVNDSKLFAEIVESYALVESKKPKKTIANKSNGEVLSNSTVDSIDAILFGKSIDSKRVQRAYYIDKDIANIIDTVDNKQKSNLVNECLRKVFKEKGLL